MKQFYLLLVLGLVIVLKADAQAPRRVLVEEFTQASCPPCAAYNPGFHGIIFTPGNETKVSLVCYQTSWPGVDPMNAANGGDVANRVSYYGVTGVPDCVADGGIDEAGNAIFHDNIANFTQGVIDDRSAVTSPVEITVDHNLSLKLDSVFINVSIKNVSAADLANNYTLNTALIEKTIEFETPPGTNGEKKFYSVMRKMVPNVAGTKLGGLAAGETKNFSFRIVMPSYIYLLRNIGVIVFLQNTAAKEVLQSAESYPKPFPNGSTYLDLNANASINGYTGLCDAGFGFKFDFLNEGTDTIKAISVDVFDNNVKMTGKTSLALNLPAGSSTTYEFTNLNFKGGKNAITFKVNNINGLLNKDVNKLNNTRAAQNALFLDKPFATELHEGFEVTATGKFPLNVYTDVDNPDATAFRVFPAEKAFYGAAYDMGGFGNSAFSLYWDFYYATKDAEAKLVYDKLDLTNSTNTHLALTRAYAQLAKENARFTVEASKDCGATWTTVYQKAGAALATVSARAAIFVPTVTQWKRDTVSMTDFDGAPEVIVRLRGYNPPSGSNLLLIDDIDIYAQAPVATEDPGILSGMNVYPNPVHDELNVQVNSREAANASIQMFDLNGRAIGFLGQNIPLRAGVNVKSFNINSYHPGLYTLKITTEKGVINSTVSIQ
jgi:hypothetical protein